MDHYRSSRLINLHLSRDVDDIPLVKPLARQPSNEDESDGDDEERYLESDELMETYQATSWNTNKKKSLKSSFKEINTGVFTLQQLSYHGFFSSLIVNENMPMRSLFVMATSYLQFDFKFIVRNIEDIDLMYKDRVLQRYGALVSEG